MDESLAEAEFHQLMENIENAAEDNTIVTIELRSPEETMPSNAIIDSVHVPEIPKNQTADGENQLATIIESQHEREKALKRRESTFAYKNRVLRESGQAYTGRRKSGDLFDQPSKGLGPPCLATAQCRVKAKSFHCCKITDADRSSFFEKFWEMKWDAKFATVKALCDRSTPKRGRGCDSTRNSSWSYYLKTSTGERIRVCQVMFCSSLGLTPTTLKRWLTTEETSPSQRKKKNSEARKPPKSSEMKKLALDFLESLPTVPSHYCRATCDSKLVESCWESVANLYR
jgi:hypothetical protein